MKINLNNTIGNNIGNTKKISEYINYINNNINNINDNMFHIGKILYEIREEKLYIFKGYKNILDFCRDELNLGKNQVYNLISIYLKFNNNEFKVYNYSQLSEMLALSEEQIKEIDGSFTVKQLRSLKKKSKINNSGIKNKQESGKESLNLYKYNESLNKQLKELNEKNLILSNELTQFKRNCIDKIKKYENEIAEYKKAIDKYLNKNLNGTYSPKWIIPEQDPLITSETDFSYEEIRGVLFYLKKANNFKPLLFKRTLDKAIYFFEHLKTMNKEKENEVKELYNKELDLTIEKINDFCYKANKMYRKNDELNSISYMIYDNTYDKDDLNGLFGKSLMYTIKREQSFDRIIIDKYY
ncbi:UNVERIFIED_ORG: hypothetical protein B2H98_08110 [Clostridium botulinum]